MSKKILLITAGHLSSCPRLLKEAKLLYSNGYQVSIIFIESIKAIVKLDKDIQKENSDWEFHPIQWNGHGADVLEVFISKLTFKINSFFRFNPNYIQSTSKILIEEVLKIRADFYIAHHPSALAAAALAAKKYDAKYAYDIEDAFAYIDTEENNPDANILNIERLYLSEASLVTSASPLYNDIYIRNFPNIVAPIRLLNVFDANEKTQVMYKDRIDTNKLSFYWYSQTIGLNRGLQDLFIAINELPEDTFELHLRGIYTAETKQSLLNLVNSELIQKNIFFHQPVSALELFYRNIEHDVGFALESNNSLNRMKCISNKILDYIRSGLVIVASKTEGHQYVLNDFGNDAYLYDSGDNKALKNILLHLINNPDLVEKAKKKSISLSIEKYNWSVESQIWIKEVNRLLA